MEKDKERQSKKSARCRFAEGIQAKRFNQIWLDWITVYPDLDRGSDAERLTRLNLYRDCLSIYTEPELRAAFIEHMRRISSGRFAPKPAEIVEHVEIARTQARTRPEKRQEPDGPRATDEEYKQFHAFVESLGRAKDIRTKTLEEDAAHKAKIKSQAQEILKKDK